MVMVLKKFSAQFDQPCASYLLILMCERGMGLSLVATALDSINIPTGLLFSQFNSFSAVPIFSGSCASVP